jgi:hypothetical protein
MDGFEIKLGITGVGAKFFPRNVFMNSCMKPLEMCICGGGERQSPQCKIVLYICGQNVEKLHHDDLCSVFCNY